MAMQQDDMHNGDHGPYTPTIVTTPVVPATEDSPLVPEQTTVETVMNMTPENRAHFESEKEAIHLILTGIGDEIYSTVDACQTAQEMWEAIERLQQATLCYAQHFQNPYYQTSKSHKSYASTSKALLPTRSHATTRYKGKEIAKPITPPSESASEEDSDPEQAQKDKDMAVNVAGARETVGGQVVQQSGIQCFNCKEFGHFAKECRKPKRVKDSTYHKEKCWKHITVNGKDSGGPNAGSAQDAEPLEQDDQNDVECDDERVALANLIANLKLDVDENKKIQKQLKKANATFCLVALQNKQTEFERYKAFNDRIVDYDKLKPRLNETLGLLAQKEIDIKEGLKVKAYEISIVKEKHDELVKQSLLTKSH
ncbi:ribonuclease H-like domain-containing protein [Tanacetum coccineum]